MKNDERDTAETAVKNAVDAKVKYVLTIIKMKAAEVKAIIMEKVLNMKAHIVAKYHGRIHLNAEKEVVNGPAIVKTDIDVAQAKGGINKPASSKTYMYAAEADTGINDANWTKSSHTIQACIRIQTWNGG